MMIEHWSARTALRRFVYRDDVFTAIEMHVAVFLVSPSFSFRRQFGIELFLYPGFIYAI